MLLPATVIDEAAGAAVLGSVGGTVVAEPELAAYLVELAASTVGLRLGLCPTPDEIVTEGGQNRANAIRSWGTRSLLLDRLVALEAARLGITRPSSPDNWVDCLQEAGELRLSPPSEPEALRCYRANNYRYRVAEARRVRHVLRQLPRANWPTSQCSPSTAGHGPAAGTSAGSSAGSSPAR
jgi:hypothetical protein